MLMTMRAGSFSTLVLLSLGVLLVLGAAVPAGAQVMTAGGDLDVYDDNGDIVGRLVGFHSLNNFEVLWVFSVEAPDGDVGALDYRSSPPGENILTGVAGPYLHDAVFFDSPDCTGNSYMGCCDNTSKHVDRSASGYHYLAPSSDVYRADLNTTPSATATGSILVGGVGCVNSSEMLDMIPAEFVATISTAFPFHVRAATSSPSAVPSGVVGVVAGVLGISGALLVRLRRS
jgi:hypothetical protein